jgi:hypothetical protein
MVMFSDLLALPDIHNNKIVPTIKAVGIFSKAIVTFYGQNELHSYLDKLIDLSEMRIVKDMDDPSSWDKTEVGDDKQEDAKNFKVILKRQKQMISFLSSYSYIINNFTHQPSDISMQHFFKLALIGTKNFRKLYEKYRPKLFESLVCMIMSLSGFEGFIHWI